MADLPTYSQIEAAGSGLFLGICNPFARQAHAATVAAGRPVLLQPHGKNAFPAAHMALSTRDEGLPCLITETKGSAGPQNFAWFGWVRRGDIFDHTKPAEDARARSGEFVFTTADDHFYGDGSFGRMAIGVFGLRPIWPLIPVSRCSSLKQLHTPSGSLSRVAARALDGALRPMLALMTAQYLAGETNAENAPRS